MKKLMKKLMQKSMKRYIFAVILGIFTFVMILMPHRSYSKEIPANFNQATPINNSDSPCFYYKSDGSVVDLRAICGTSSIETPHSSGATSTLSPTSSQNQSSSKVEVNPAMKITRPNDPGVLYISGSGGIDRGAQLASQAERTGR
jgi:hypothetical protein